MMIRIDDFLINSHSIEYIGPLNRVSDELSNATVLLACGQKLLLNREQLAKLKQWLADHDRPQC